MQFGTPFIIPPPSRITSRPGASTVVFVVIARVLARLSVPSKANVTLPLLELPQKTH